MAVDVAAHQQEKAGQEEEVQKFRCGRYHVLFTSTGSLLIVYTTCMQVKLMSFGIREEATFLDYIRGG